MNAEQRIVELEHEVRRLRALAYLGDHHFPDLTWKERCLEAASDLRTLQNAVLHLLSDGDGKMSNALLEGIRNFVEKSGGLEKVHDLRKAITEIPLEHRVRFIRSAVKTEEGARQVLAAALLGLIIADVVYTGTAHRQSNAKVDNG
jgi:hypothetical protein